MADVGRKRKAHTKSRRGCGNCKLRRVKCDEGRPACEKCRSYGVSCSYEGGDTSTELQHDGEGAFEVQPAETSQLPTSTADRMEDLVANIMPKPSRPLGTNASLNLPPTPPAEIILGMLDYPLKLHDTDEVYVCTARDLDRLRRFHERTVLTIGTAQTIHIYRDSITQLGMHHDYVTHIIFTIVLMHDRYLSDDPWQGPTTEETFHHYHGTAMFNKMLSAPLAHSEKDAMWAAAALLGAITIAAVDAKTAEGSWPLKAAAPQDLDWLRMSDGKKEVWRLADPLREDSIWRPALMYQFDKDPPALARRPELKAFVPVLTRLCGYDSTSDGTGNPYHTATSIVIRLLPIQCTHSTILYFLSFIGHMEPEFKDRLHQKDERALLLLAWWYAKMLDYPSWWLQRRANLECKSLCIYLSRRYMMTTDVGKLLEFPKMMCGLAVSNEFANAVDQARSAQV
ncbi:hypothetical protein LTR78_010037 [Recurvomyces mirabilis]|uniref:Zn(2)-C6 fungal-type domain-containing protein n=1 Tax=Recurvomyces mirabilis TaxID=574656 RepID=A0AAE0TN12_9PEZI|nr:hypothetical protein LTR78_010037 [Recurvomyces mirabilis]KAK5149818.1 hypothetical protein LTS14_010639 [Recurvomyces mirabilis]